MVEPQAPPFFTTTKRHNEEHNSYNGVALYNHRNNGTSTHGGISAYTGH